LPLIWSQMFQGWVVVHTQRSTIATAGQASVGGVI
jgi:hypothetical protein